WRAEYSKASRKRQMLLTCSRVIAGLLLGKRLPDRNEGRWIARVVDNAPVLRGTARWLVFRAGESRFRSPDSIDLGHRRGAALVAGCGLAGSGVHRYATGPADR